MTYSNWIAPLSSSSVMLATVGGKGLNLARLFQAGFPVPGGYLITTAAYRTYVAVNKLQPFIEQTLAPIRLDEPEALQQAAKTIRDRFAEGKIPDDLAQALIGPYAGWGHAAVAVRSSATAEDLPDMSFAGQQDTYLNIIGADALLKSVVDCWSSLWTARAIGYRARNAISNDDVALAVIVQRMVQSEVSGVLFTANPLTGRRTETVIDATLGLGEALVSGQVEPDHYLVDSNGGLILDKVIGAKSLVIESKSEGGTRTKVGLDEKSQALPDTVILELVEMGKRVTAHYRGEPQDIEWAWADEQLFLLQSRPITSLYPLPPGISPDPLQIMFSFAAVQGIMEPITPIGQDVLILFFTALARLFQPQTTPEDQGAVLVAGERLYLNFTGVFRHKLGRKLALGAMAWIEPGMRQALNPFLNDSRLAVVPRHIRLISWLRLFRFMAGIVRGTLYTLARPEAARRATQQYVQTTETRLRALFQETTDFRQQLEAFEDFLLVAPQQIFPSVLPRIVAGMAMLNLLLKLAGNLPDGKQLVLEITRGLPHNVTTEMDLSLWDTAQAIRADAQSVTTFRQEDAGTLSDLYLSGTLPPVAQAAVSSFMARYGMRGLGEIDIGRPRWRENPAPVMQSLQSYLNIEDAEQAPNEVFKRGAASAEQAIGRLVGELRQTRRGRFKAKIAGFAAGRVRAIAGLRETPKFLIIRVMGIAREAFLKSGVALADSGQLHSPNDVFFLFLDELQALAAGGNQDWQAEVSEHRATYARELRRQQVPRLLLSDGQAIYEGLGAATAPDDKLINGSPVSPGVVEGPVRVVFDPNHSQLVPGEILVCPGTDPSWTPLFLAAGGLIMEVGGMMTHGSVVAREYGIPAVVGVHQATSRLQTGQYVRVDGSSGRIYLLNERGKKGTG